MMRRMGPMPMAIMVKMLPICMAFMVIAPALLAFGVGVLVGRGPRSR